MRILRSRKRGDILSERRCMAVTGAAVFRLCPAKATSAPHPVPSKSESSLTACPTTLDPFPLFPSTGVSTVKRIADAPALTAALKSASLFLRSVCKYSCHHSGTFGNPSSTSSLLRSSPISAMVRLELFESPCGTPVA